MQSIRRGGKNEPMVASVEQVRENDFIIDRPMIGANIHPLAINEPLRISFMGDTGHCSGLTKPLGRYRFSSGGKSANRVMHGYKMAIPEELESSNRRRYHRVSLEHGAPLHVTLHPQGTTTPMKAVVIDVSAGGMRLRLKNDAMLIDGQDMLLTAELPAPYGSVAESVHAVRVIQCPRTRRPIVCVSFPEEMANIARYVRQLEIQRARRAGAA